MAFALITCTQGCTLPSLHSALPLLEVSKYLAGNPNSRAAEEPQVGVRPAAVRDYWAIAEVHAQSFYPSANWLFAQLLRLDRVFALQVNPARAPILAIVRQCLCR